MTGKLLLVTTTILVLGLLERSFAQEKDREKAAGKREEKGESGKKGRRETWAVVQVGDEILVVQEEKIPGLQKELQKTSKDKPRKKGEKPEPKKTVKVLKKNLSSYEEAEKAREKLGGAKKKRQKTEKGEKEKVEKKGKSAKDEKARKKPAKKDETPDEEEE